MGTGHWPPINCHNAPSHRGDGSVFLRDTTRAAVAGQYKQGSEYVDESLWHMPPDRRLRGLLAITAVTTTYFPTRGLLAINGFIDSNHDCAADFFSSRLGKR